MLGLMDNQQALAHINELADEEHALRRTEGSGGLDEAGHARLREVELQLDQLWDLLRQRRAHREMGFDPDDAMERPSDEVERYQQ
jgi:hypothetical protein